MSFKQNISLVVKVWKAVIELVSRFPKMFFPFFFVGLADSFILIAMVMAPRPPFSRVLAPIIRAFWGDQFLHYPMNFVLLPKLFQYTHIVMVGFIGVVMTGISISMVEQAVKGIKPSIFSGFKASISKFISLLMVWFAMFALVSGTFKLSSIILTKFTDMSFFASLPVSKVVMGEIFYWTNLILSIVIEVFFLFAIPSLVIDRTNIFGAFKKTFSVARKYFVTTFILIFTPSILYLGIIFLRRNMMSLSQNTVPEVVVYVLAAGIVVSVVIDFMVTLSGAILFLLDRQGDWVLAGGEVKRTKMVETEEDEVVLNAA